MAATIRLDKPQPAQPFIVIVDNDAAALALMARTIGHRFGADYRIVTADSARQGLIELERLAEGDEEIAVIAADLRLAGTDGIAFLEQAHLHHPHAIRALLVTMDQRGTRIPFSELEHLQRATALGRIDFAITKGWSSPEEWLYPQLQEGLTTWTRTRRPRHHVVRVVGEQWDPRSHELRDALARNTVPFGFYDVQSETGQQLIHDHGVDPHRLPAVIFRNGTVLHDPSLVEVAEALGVHTQPRLDVYDVVILGAGPAGMSAAVYAASEGLQTLVVEPQAIGGQAGTSSMIRNYLGFPRGIGGSDLSFRAWEQALLFGAKFIFMQRAVGLSTVGNERVISLSDGSQVVSRTVIIATGVEYRRLEIPSLDRFVGAGVFYGAAGVEAPAMVGEDVFVVGGANSAGQAAIHLAKFADRVTLVVRGSSLAAGMSDYLITQIAATPNIEVQLGTRVVDGHGERRLRGVTVEDIATGQRVERAAAAVFVLIGAEPHTSWVGDAVQVDGRGFLLTGADITPELWTEDRPPLPFETSLPGVFVIGDVRHGSVKRVAAAVGEGSVAIGSVHRYLTDSAPMERSAHPLPLNGHADPEPRPAANVALHR